MKSFIGFHPLTTSSVSKFCYLPILNIYIFTYACALNLINHYQLKKQKNTVFIVNPTDHLVQTKSFLLLQILQQIAQTLLQ